MAEFFITKKSAPSSADKAASGVMARKTAPAPASGNMKTGKGHFAAAAQRIAKKRSGNLQTGLVKHAPVGASDIKGSKVPPKSKKVGVSSAQMALNPEQQGKQTNEYQGRGYTSDSTEESSGV